MPDAHVEFGPVRFSVNVPWNKNGSNSMCRKGSHIRCASCVRGLNKGENSNVDIVSTRFELLVSIFGFRNFIISSALLCLATMSSLLIQ